MLTLIPDRSLRLEHLSLYDGTDSPVVRDATVIVQGARVTYAGTAPPAAGEDDQVINCTGQALLPGLINCHVHMFSAEPQPLVMNSIKATRIAERMLQCGITTIRSLGGEKTQLGEITLRNAIRDGVTPGPRMFAAGSRITMTGGFGARNARVADGPDELRKAAREQLEAGSDLIKLVATKNTPSPGREMAAPELTIAEMAAAVEEAAKWGKYTAAHAMGVTGIKNALRAGVECIEHGNLLDDEAIELMLAAGAWLDPTFSVHERQIAHASDLGLAPAYVDRLKIGNEALYRSYQKAITAGVAIATGTDAGTPANPHDDMTLELRCVVDAGASVPRALHNATLNAARLLGIAGEVGSIQTGMLADLIVVDGDLERSFAPITDPWLVLQSGTPVGGRAIHKPRGNSQLIR